MSHGGPLVCSRHSTFSIVEVHHYLDHQKHPLLLRAGRGVMQGSGSGSVPFQTPCQHMLCGMIAAPLLSWHCSRLAFCDAHQSNQSRSQRAILLSSLPLSGFMRFAVNSL